MRYNRISGYHNYMISESGDIYSIRECKSGLKIHKRKDQNNGKGYRVVSLCKNGKCRSFLVHRLVANTFIDNPQNKETVNHIDENKSNNNVNNLEWCTHKENIDHYHKGKYDNLSVSQRNIKGELIAVWDSVNSASKCGFNKESIVASCINADKLYKSFKWNFGYNLDEVNNSHFIDMRAT